MSLTTSYQSTAIRLPNPLQSLAERISKFSIQKIKSRPAVWAALVLASFSSLETHAAVLDLEQVNGVVPYEGMSVSNQFKGFYGITFSLIDFNTQEPDGAPVIARVGPPTIAFRRKEDPEELGDTPKGDEAALYGTFFLTEALGLDHKHGDLVLDFESPVSKATGVILDIDGTEVVRVFAYSDREMTHQVGETIVLSKNDDTGSGLGTRWSFNQPRRDILRIKIHTRSRAGQGKANVGFDLFQSDYVPKSWPAPSEGISLFPGVTIHGVVGMPYRVGSAAALSGPWNVLTNVFLPTSPFLFIDTTVPPGSARRFYQVQKDL